MFKKMIFLSVALLVSACATEKQKTELDAKVKAEPPASSAQQIMDRGAEVFANAPGLTADQKQKILAVYARTGKEAMDIRTEIGKAKSLLFKTAASANTSSKEMDLLRKKIVNLDQKRLQIMFKALADVQAVVGTGKETEEIYRHFYDYENPTMPFSQRQ